jgi:hypothetical protein
MYVYCIAVYIHTHTHTHTEYMFALQVRVSAISTGEIRVSCYTSLVVIFKF